MVTFENFQRILRTTLNHLYDPDYLRKSSFAVWLGVAERYDTPTALRNILVDEIESLRPVDSSAHGGNDQQVYDILLFRYIQQSDPDEVAHQMGVSDRQLRRLQANALEILSYHLWKKYRLEEKSSASQEALDPERKTEELPTGSVPSPAGRNDFDWLKTTPVQKPLDIPEELKKVLALIHPMMVQYRANLNLNVQDPLPQIAVHPVAFRQSMLGILGELLKRAVGEKIQVNVAALEGRVELSLSCDIENHNADLNAQAKGIQDTSRILELSNGNLELEISEKCAVFKLRFPIMPIFDVLVVDDNADLIDLITRYADGTQYHVIGLREPRETIPVALREKVQVIVLDIMMSDDDGWEVLGRLRSHPQTSHIPIVICTILSQEELARMLGAAAFIQKPVRREVFLEVLESLTAKLAPESR
jgi:CheY-like chemotaxis protein